MPLPSVAPLSLQQIYTEFNAPLSTALTALVRGGAYVPNTPVNAGVPTAPPIGVLNFLGASRLAADVQNASANDVVTQPANASARLTIDADGITRRITSTGGSVSLYTWRLSGNSNEYECRADVTVGSIQSGTAGVWLDCAANNSWACLASVPGSTTSAQMTVQIRIKSTGQVLDSATWNLTAECDIA